MLFVIQKNMCYAQPIVGNPTIKALKDDGVFILEAYTEHHLKMQGVGGPPQKELFMSLAELKTELKGLDFIIGDEIIRNISEGNYHQGESAVVEVLACKTKSFE